MMYALTLVDVFVGILFLEVEEGSVVFRVTADKVLK
jgi:hypothetical protein